MASLDQRYPDNAAGALLDVSFEWVLPGHGAWHRAESAATMRRDLEKCIRWMKEKL